MYRRLLAATSVGGLMATAWLAQAQQPAPAPVTTVVVHGDKPGVKHDWFKAESQHFVVYSDTKHSDVAALLSKLERFRYVLRNLSNMDGGDHEPRLTLYYLSDQGQLRTIDPQIPEHAVGLYQSCEDGVQGYAVDTPFKPKEGVPVLQQDEDTGLTYIFRAYTRHFFEAHFPIRTPAWYIDGYAQYFSTLRFDGNDAIVGLPPHALASYIAGIESENYQPRMTYQDLLNDNDLYNVNESDLINGEASASAAQATDSGHPLRSDLTNVDPQHADEINQAEVATEFQARAWLMTHWLLSSPKNLGLLADYVTAVGHGENRLDAFNKRFNLNSAQMDNVLRDYLRHQAKLVRFKFKSLPDAEVTFDDEPAAANHLMLDAAALQGCPSPAYGRALLADVHGEAAQYPDSELAQLALSRGEIAYGDPQKALPWLTKQVQTAPGDFDALHLLGRAELAIAQKTNDAGAYDAAKVAFTQAAKIDASSAVNAFWYYRAQVTATGQVPQDAAGAAVLAQKTAPEVDAYAVHAGLVYALAGDGKNAFAALHIAADSPRPGPWTKTARQWIVRLKSGVTNDELLAALGKPLQTPGDGDWRGQLDWTQAYEAVLGDVDLQKGQADLQAAIARMKAATSTNGSPSGTRPAPKYGVRMPGDDDY